MTMHQVDLIGDPAPRRTTRAEARAKRDIGMQRVGDKAERCCPGWTAAVLERLRIFVRGQIGMFTMEQARWVLQREVPAPPDLRAWGVITKLALQSGVIEHTGKSAPAYSSNGAAKCLYRRGAKA